MANADYPGDGVMITDLFQLADVVLSGTNGLKPTTGNKLLYWNGTTWADLVPAGAITTPNAQTGSYVQADVTSLKTAIDAIRAALTAAGITA